MRSKAFTLIELLVVIAIIALLAAILFPVFAQAKTAAKRASDLSNVKQITLGVIQYEGDSDDVPPLYQQTPLGAAEFSPSMISWKDILDPYVKNGSSPFNNGQKYSRKGGGGIYESPLAEAPWSSASVGANANDPGYVKGDGWPGYNYPSMNGGTGDCTTRFARSYALNQVAGANEMGYAKAIMAATKQNADGSISFNWNGQPAAATLISDPSRVLLVVPTRTYQVAVQSTIMYGTCSADGRPRGTSSTEPLSCIRSTRNRNLTGGFFDGHVKNVNGVSTIRLDMWDDQAAFDALIHGSGSAESDAQAAAKLKEWKDGL